MSATEEPNLYLPPFLLLYGNLYPKPEKKDRKHLWDTFKSETSFSLAVVVTGLNVTMYDNLKYPVMPPAFSFLSHNCAVVADTGCLSALDCDRCVQAELAYLSWSNLLSFFPYILLEPLLIYSLPCRDKIKRLNNYEMWTGKAVNWFWRKIVSSSFDILCFLSNRFSFNWQLQIHICLSERRCS